MSHGSIIMKVINTELGSKQDLAVILTIRGWRRIYVSQTTNQRKVITGYGDIRNSRNQWWKG